MHLRRKVSKKTYGQMPTYSTREDSCVRLCTNVIPNALEVRAKAQWRKNKSPVVKVLPGKEVHMIKESSSPVYVCSYLGFKLFTINSVYISTAGVITVNTLASSLSVTSSLVVVMFIHAFIKRNEGGINVKYYEEVKKKMKKSCEYKSVPFIMWWW